MIEYNLPSVCKVKSENEVEVHWDGHPKRILLVHKFCEDEIFPCVVELATFVLEHWNVCILLVEKTFPELSRCDVYNEKLHSYLVCTSREQYDALKLPADRFSAPTLYSTIDDNVRVESCLGVYQASMADSIDLVICMGGDGTLLQVASMFQEVVPPVIGFALGTHCFLIPFQFESYRTSLKWAMDSSPTCLLRSRLYCRVVREGGDQQPAQRISSPTEGSSSGSSTSSSPDLEYHCLNDLVIDRGISASMCDLTIKVSGKTVTIIEGDGLIVSTSTGSTAYSMAAGSSILHPSIPAYILTTICSLTLSSRAIVLPSSLPLEISLTPTSRHQAAHFSFDGRSRGSNMIHHGDAIHIMASPYPVPSIVPVNQAADWFCRLTNLVKWNIRRSGPAHRLDKISTTSGAKN